MLTSTARNGKIILVSYFKGDDSFIMPKVIHGIRESILKRADEIIELGDYDKFSMREIAKKCSVAVGTLYNYFPSKDELLLAVIDSHWQDMMETVDRRCAEVTTLTDGMCYICEGVREFSEKHTEFWISTMMGSGNHSACSEWKRTLRPAVMDRFVALCKKLGYAHDEELLPAIAEIIIALGSQCEIDIKIAIKLLRQSAGKLESMQGKG